MIFKAKIPADLIDKIYQHHGWIRKAGESRTKRVTEQYDITVDWKTNLMIATTKKRKGDDRKETK